MPAQTPSARSRAARPGAVGPLLVVLSAVLLSVGVLGACGASAPSVDDLTKDLVTSGLDEDQARCAAEAVVGELSASEISTIMERGPSGVPVDDAKVADEPIDRVRAALGECRTLSLPDR